MALPCVLFSSSTGNHKPDDLVKKILKVLDLPEPCLVNDTISGYEWSFETKYYTATIHLCTTDKRTIGDEEFADNMQAFIHVFDPNEDTINQIVLKSPKEAIIRTYDQYKIVVFTLGLDGSRKFMSRFHRLLLVNQAIQSESFELTKAWLPYLNHIEPVVQILVCETSKHSDVISRKSVLQWCVEHGFELVELSPEEDSDDEDNDFPETTGMARIVQALHSHTWSNLEMKDNPSVQSPYFRQMMQEQYLINNQEKVSSEASLPSESSSIENEHSLPCAESVSSQSVEEKLCDQKTKNGNCEVDFASQKSSECAGKESISDETLETDSVDWRAFVGADNQDSTVTNEDAGVEEFEQLFQKLKFMKDKAETLPVEERKKYAEKVALSFWKAIGGDEDEISGLDGDSD